MGITFAQPMEQHFLKDVSYADISALVFKIIEKEGGKDEYQLFGSSHYLSQEIDNYLTIPTRSFPRGRYLIRLCAAEP